MLVVSLAFLIKNYVLNLMFSAVTICFYYVQAVKQDFIRSLTARLQMHADSLVEDEPSPPEGNIC